ncbi:uncharacterized protein MAM_03227 [Metarhizium album ARSEF 1941]|uniref:Nucleotide exchange factor SIL1 n=1 Tax=Metarhizium album (strain ARSEF 1941) TaxID=1081103 RepID=A0A0B2X137_METAS|nr:uncharacterized protein MAM_03227 [Metarhizium album ARSEF 1941]KHN98765.1 hypothetical protein MAM_03227 [Metarhizium album ARSEF 1941]
MKLLAAWAVVGTAVALVAVAPRSDADPGTPDVPCKDNKCQIQSHDQEAIDGSPSPDGIPEVDPPEEFGVYDPIGAWDGSNYQDILDNIARQEEIEEKENGRKELGILLDADKFKIDEKMDEKIKRLAEKKDKDIEKVFNETSSVMTFKTFYLAISALSIFRNYGPEEKIHRLLELLEEQNPQGEERSAPISFGNKDPTPEESVKVVRLLVQKFLLGSEEDRSKAKEVIGTSKNRDAQLAPQALTFLKSVKISNKFALLKLLVKEQILTKTNIHELYEIIAKVISLSEHQGKYIWKRSELRKAVLKNFVEIFKEVKEKTETAFKVVDIVIELVKEIGMY